MHPEQALPTEFEPAFDLLLRHLEKQERRRRVEFAVELIRLGRLNPHGLFVLRGQDELLGVVACEPLSGAAGILWPPVVLSEDVAHGEDLLVRHATAWLQQQGARLAQALLTAEELPLAAGLLRNGFSRITTLSYLSCDRRHFPREAHRSEHLVYEPYDPSHPAVFLETLNRTYELTRDCPEVSGVRTIEEVIQGHQTQGSLARDRWWLVRIGSVSQVGCWSALAAGTPIGVMLTSQEKRGETWEVGYMGLIPEARKLGFGSEMLHKVLAEARADAAPRVTLSVDDRNVPAWRLYRRLGFEPYDQRTVFLTIWRRAS